MRKTIAETGLTDHERRILAYLEQHGATDRSRMVRDLAAPGTRIAQYGGNGSNGFIPAIAANWTRRLVDEGFVTLQRERHFDELPRQFAITASGRQFRRSVPFVN